MLHCLYPWLTVVRVHSVLNLSQRAREKNRKKDRKGSWCQKSEYTSINPWKRGIGMLMPNKRACLRTKYNVNHNPTPAPIPVYINDLPFLLLYIGLCLEKVTISSNFNIFLFFLLWVAFTLFVLKMYGVHCYC